MMDYLCKRYMKKGILYLIPHPLAEDTLKEISPRVKEVAQNLRIIIAEEIRTARRYLRAIDRTFPIDETIFYQMDKHKAYAVAEEALEKALKGADIGVMSEAGCPGIADPGWQIAAAAHAKGIRVVPLAGPNSMIMALTASGFSGQKFTFHGYLPVDTLPRKKVIQEMEKAALEGYAQIFMETPYRNNPLMDQLLETLKGDTMLSVSSALTSSKEFVLTKAAKDWKLKKPDLHKQPAVFVIGKSPS
jgi:16S rRNA (cytidine1402-2'-O)-methyltransferase